MKWIPVIKRTPEPGDEVLVIGNCETELYSEEREPSVGLVVWENENKSECKDTCCYYIQYNNITHWCVPPKLP